MTLLITKRKALFVFVAFTFLLYCFHGKNSPYRLTYGSSGKTSHAVKPTYDWANVSHDYPVESMASMPTSLAQIPPIQHDFKEEGDYSRTVRLKRQAKVKDQFLHAWHGYKKHAWMHDELLPVSGGASDPFGGWATTLVDSLDTLWIMNLTDEFDEAVYALDQIDFSTCELEELNVFEATARYLGAFLAAYDLSGGQYPSLLEKATAMGHMLYKAFDTPNRMPILRWNFRAALEGYPQEADATVLVSELGSLTMEFTRLSQLTGDPRWYDASQRVMDIFEAQQLHTKLPGMFPSVVNAKMQDFSSNEVSPDTAFTIGTMADSLYEYFPKQHLMLHGASWSAQQQYRKLWLRAAQPIKKHVLYRPMTPGNKDVLLAGDVHLSGGQPPAFTPTTLVLEPKNQHLACFAGGAFALAGRAFGVADDVDTGRRLTEGCLWTHETGSPHGIPPELMYTLPCPQSGPFSGDGCEWQEDAWYNGVESAHAGLGQSADELIQQRRLRKGIVRVDDPRYLLRPETIESVFVLHRVTGDWRLPERAWRIFERVIENTRTRHAHAALEDWGETARQADRMEGVWLAETLKYFYLLFEDPQVVSLDEWVFNTRGHPLRWGRGDAGGRSAGELREWE